MLSRGPTENGHRPAVDALFRSAAVTWRTHVAGVVLSGTLDDGTAGLAEVKARGGIALVQDLAEALYGGMPRSALASVAVDRVLRARDMGAVRMKAFHERAAGADPSSPLTPDPLDPVEERIDAGDVRGADDEIAALTEPSGLSCPDCQGVLFTVVADRRFRCRVGHAWTAKALLAQQNVELERALWTALRALEEKRQLAKRMAATATGREPSLDDVQRRWERSHRGPIHAYLRGPTSRRAAERRSHSVTGREGYAIPP